MNPIRCQQLERLLRRARQRVFDEPRYAGVIERCKRRLGLDQPGIDPARTRWAETMWA